MLGNVCSLVSYVEQSCIHLLDGDTFWSIHDLAKLIPSKVYITEKLSFFTYDWDGLSGTLSLQCLKCDQGLLHSKHDS